MHLFDDARPERDLQRTCVDGVEHGAVAGDLSLRPVRRRRLVVNELDHPRMRCARGSARIAAQECELCHFGRARIRAGEIRQGVRPLGASVPRGTICLVCPELSGASVVWQLQAAKQHFSELVERARREGPQVVTKHGKDAVVVMSAEDYQRLRPSGPGLVDFIRSAPDFELLDLRRATDQGRDVDV